MRRIALRALLVAALIVVGFVLGACRVEQAQTQVAKFHFTIQRTDTGVKITLPSTLTRPRPPLRASASA